MTTKKTTLKHTERSESVHIHTPPDTDDDEEFTIQEVTNVVMGMGKKAPGEDGIPNEVWEWRRYYQSI
jgi:hypothetical protein